MQNVVMDILIYLQEHDVINVRKFFKIDLLKMLLFRTKVFKSLRNYSKIRAHFGHFGLSKMWP